MKRLAVVAGFFLCLWPVFSFAIENAPYLIVLGIAQDGGYPQAGCNKECCRQFYRGQQPKKHITCLALIDPQTKKSWMFECTPDFGEQLQLLRRHLHDSAHLPSGIFITHAHIGHYSGLTQLGKEVMGTHNIPVYAMPRMSSFLKNNGPWSQLAAQHHIALTELSNLSAVSLGANISVKPVQVPHRDEYSETVGFDIRFGNKSVLFIPDIDKWEKWDYPNQLFPGDSFPVKLQKLVAAYSYVLIDGTFFKNGELPGRDMSEIPHPFIEETMRLLEALPAETKNRIYFIHFNHTNPVLRSAPVSSFRFATELMILN
ncbi:MAG: MBL fold metallo-hydrolase [Bacteroidia bacterium]|nr:MBL fold metallo-hydrolase [Bacteroidia bacterium]